MNTKLYTLLALMAALIGAPIFKLNAYRGGYHRGGYYHGGHGGAVAAGVAGGVVGGALIGSAIAADSAARTATAPVNPNYYYDDEPYYYEDEYVDGPVYVEGDDNYARGGRYHDTRAPRSDSNERIPAKKHVTETGRESRNSNQQGYKNK